LFYNNDFITFRWRLTTYDLKKICLNSDHKADRKYRTPLIILLSDSGINKKRRRKGEALNRLPLCDGIQFSRQIPFHPKRSNELPSCPKSLILKIIKLRERCSLFFLLCFLPTSSLHYDCTTCSPMCQELFQNFFNNLLKNLRTNFEQPLFAGNARFDYSQ
jgi:hypothetical protein